jgi:hypothetical protein
MPTLSYIRFPDHCLKTTVFLYKMVTHLPSSSREANMTQASVLALWCTSVNVDRFSKDLKL